ncbi:DUF58 domain-containing protein [bacterium]|nr:MAG: DUF58 domain-containing protein [bacterium]
MIISPEIITQLAPLEMKARHIVEGFITGIHKSPYYGFSVEFAEHRPYNAGDELRHVDWKVYGKSERFYVKQFEEETNLRCYVLLDISSSMHFKYYADWDKLRYGTHLAASLIHLMNRQRDATGLITFDESIREFIPPRTSQAHLRLLYSSLSQHLTPPDKKNPEKRKTASADVLHELAERIEKRSMLIIITDLFENIKQNSALVESLKHLRHKKHDIVLLNVHEKRVERELDLPDKKFVLTDMETGARMDVMPVQLRETYKEKMREHVHQFKKACSEYQIDFFEIDTQEPFDRSLLAYLNRRRRIAQ